MHTPDDNGQIATGKFGAIAILLALLAVSQRAGSSLQYLLTVLALGFVLIPVLVNLALEAWTRAEIESISTTLFNDEQHSTEVHNVA